MSNSNRFFHFDIPLPLLPACLMNMTQHGNSLDGKAGTRSIRGNFSPDLRQVFTWPFDMLCDSFPLDSGPLWTELHRTEQKSERNGKALLQRRFLGTPEGTPRVLNQDKVFSKQLVSCQVQLTPAQTFGKAITFGLSPFCFLYIQRYAPCQTLHLSMASSSKVPTPA